MTVRSVGNGPTKVRGSSEPTGKSKRRGRPGYDLPTLLEGSVEVFHKMGFDGASMEDLSKHLGISKSAIYHHVASKDELLGLALNRALDALDEVVQGALLMEVGPLEQLEWTLRESVVALIQHKQFVALLLRVRGNTKVERSALARRRQFDDFLAALVEEAAEQGLVNSSLDPRVSARLLFGMVNSLTDWAQPGSNPDSVANTVVTLAFTGLIGHMPTAPEAEGTRAAQRSKRSLALSAHTVAPARLLPPPPAG